MNQCSTAHCLLIRHTVRTKGTYLNLFRGLPASSRALPFFRCLAPRRGPVTPAVMDLLQCPVRLAMSTDRAAGDISARPWAGPLGEICRCQCLICMLRVCLCLTSYVHGLFLYLLGSPFECITAPCSLCRLLHTSLQGWIVIIWEEVWTGLAASTALESCLYLTSTQGRIY